MGSMTMEPGAMEPGATRPGVIEPEVIHFLCTLLRGCDHVSACGREWSLT